eukprot:7076653-Prymnesium_polylepis.1
MATPRGPVCVDPHAGRPNMTLWYLAHATAVRRDLLAIRPGSTDALAFCNDPGGDTQHTNVSHHQRATAHNPGECDGVAPDRRSRQ